MYLRARMAEAYATIVVKSYKTERAGVQDRSRQLVQLCRWAWRQEMRVVGGQARMCNSECRQAGGEKLRGRVSTEAVRTQAVAGQSGSHCDRQASVLLG